MRCCTFMTLLGVVLLKGDGGIFLFFLGLFLEGTSVLEGTFVLSTGTRVVVVMHLPHFLRYSSQNLVLFFTTHSFCSIFFTTFFLFFLLLINQSWSEFFHSMLSSTPSPTDPNAKNVRLPSTKMNCGLGSVRGASVLMVISMSGGKWIASSPCLQSNHPS